MIKQACIIVAISGLVSGIGMRHGHAGWSDAGSSLTLGAASLVISIKKHKNDDDDDQQENDDDHHKKKKNADDDNGLSDCTIQSSNSGGGCKTGFKRVCEKLKSGKKCCGCVVDKNAKPAEAQQPVEPKVCCTGTYASGVVSGPDCGTEAVARASIQSARINGVGVVEGSIKCVPAK